MGKKRDNWADGLRSAYHAFQVMKMLESIFDSGGELAIRPQKTRPTSARVRTSKTRSLTA